MRWLTTLPIARMLKSRLLTVGLSALGISDRGDYDFRAHSEKTGVRLVACEKFAKPKEVEKLVIRPNKKELGPAFKHDHTFVVEALKAMTKKEAMEMKAALESEGKIEFEVCKLQKTVAIKKGTSIGEKDAMADELGVSFTVIELGDPFTVTVSKTCTTIRERDSGDIIRLKLDEVMEVVKKTCTTWADLLKKYEARTFASRSV